MAKIHGKPTMNTEPNHEDHCAGRESDCSRGNREDGYEDWKLQVKDPGAVQMGYLANVCNNCGICPYANRKPRSAFNWVLRWHRSWYPAWTAHSKFYGMKSLSG